MPSSGICCYREKQLFCSPKGWRWIIPKKKKDGGERDRRRSKSSINRNKEMNKTVFQEKKNVLKIWNKCSISRTQSSYRESTVGKYKPGQSVEKLITCNSIIKTLCMIQFWFFWKDRWKKTPSSQENKAVFIESSIRLQRTWQYIDNAPIYNYSLYYQRKKNKFFFLQVKIKIVFMYRHPLKLCTI